MNLAMNALRAYDEIIEFIAEANPSKVLAFHPSEATEERVSDLVYRKNTTGLSDEEKAELDHYARLEHVMRMAKIRVRQLMEP